MRPIYSVVAAAATFLGAAAVGDKNPKLLQTNVQAATNASAISADRKPDFRFLKEVIKESEHIFSGVCTKIEKIEKDPKTEYPVIELTFKITDGLKGVKGGEFKFRLSGNSNNPKENIFHEKQKCILLLRTPTGGLTGALGLYGRKDRFDVYKKDGEMGEFVFYEYGGINRLTKEFKYEDFMKTIKDIITKQSNKK